MVRGAPSCAASSLDALARRISRRPRAKRGRPRRLVRVQSATADRAVPGCRPDRIARRHDAAATQRPTHHPFETPRAKPIRPSPRATGDRQLLHRRSHPVLQLIWAYADVSSFIVVCPQHAPAGLDQRSEYRQRTCRRNRAPGSRSDATRRMLARAVHSPPRAVIRRTLRLVVHTLRVGGRMRT